MITRVFILIMASFFSSLVWAESNKSTQMIVFVSFSMPRQSLIAYLHDAKKIHAPVVIRGLVNNSFRETFAAVTNIVKESGGGVELNPPLFEKFNIKTVPTVVILSTNFNCLTGNSCSMGDFDKITGDIPLGCALKQLRDKGQVAQQSASDLLIQLRGAAHA